jgi:serine/threonine protein kinase
LNPENTFADEEKILAKISHPNIIRFCGAYSGNHGRVLILQSLPNQDMMRSLSSWKAKDEESVRGFVRDIAAALDYLHNDVKVIHRDVKPDNVIIVNGKAILIDFDRAIDSCEACPEDDSEYHDLLGTLRYRPPEYIENGIYNEKGDVWALGITAVTMYSKQWPFTSDNEEDIEDETLNGLDQNRLESLLSGMSPEGRDALRGMLAVDEESRLSSAELRGHEWLRSGPSPVEHPEPSPVEASDPIVD